METLDGASKEERLPVLLSGIGVPAIQSTNPEPMGKQIAVHTVALLVEWNCKDSVCGMVFFLSVLLHCYYQSYASM